jgi:hypothetical protein
MPLVVPGVNNNATATSSGNPKDEEWTQKLVGKKLHDSESNETVLSSTLLSRQPSHTDTFR